MHKRELNVRAKEIEMFEYKEQFDFSYHGIRQDDKNGDMTIRYDHGLIHDKVMIGPTCKAGMTAKITRVVHYYHEEEIYKQRFDITGLIRGKRYIMSGSFPVAELECVNEDEYRFHINALYGSEIKSDYITVEKGEGGVGFFDGENEIGRSICQDDSIYADFDVAALPFAHLLILPIPYLLFDPSEGSIINTDMELLFNKANERMELYLKEMNKLMIKDLMNDVHQPNDQTDLVVSPRTNLMADVLGYWPRHLMLAAEIETFREQLIGMWTPDSIIEEDRYIENEVIQDFSIMGKRRPYL